MKIIQEDNFADIMKDEVEPYLYAHCRECYITGAKEPERREKNGKLHVKFYETDRPKGVIIISHGFTEGAQKYDEMIYYFLKAGYHVCMPEHMGHGLSYRLTEDPSLVHIDTWKRFVRDFLKVCHVVKEQYSELPLFLLAHSMGGAIGTIAAGDGAFSEDHTQFADDTAAYRKCAMVGDCCNCTGRMSGGKKCKVCDRSETL